MFAQNVIDQIRGDGDLPPGFLLPWKTSLDQPCDHRTLPETALHQWSFREPGFEIISQHVLSKQRGQRQLLSGDRMANVAEPPNRQSILVGDKAQWTHSGALKAPRQQHTQGLVSQAPLKRIADEIIFAAARKGLH